MRKRWTLNAAGGLMLMLGALINAQANTPESQLQTLVKALNAELSRGEKERLADPWFLKDLRELVRKYDDPWTQVILHDDFSGRDSQPGSPWRVTRGEFLVDWRHGLRSVVQSKIAAPAPEPAAQPDVASALIGALLKDALKTDNAPAAAPAKAEAGEAKVIAPVTFAGGFSAIVRLSVRPVTDSGSSQFAFGPYQGADAVAGYRLVYRADANQDSGTLELVRQTVNGGQAVIDRSRTAVKIADGAVHELHWTRGRDGQMEISLDGQSVMSVVDRGYQGAFDGFALRNAGGDFAVREFSLKSGQ